MPIPTGTHRKPKADLYTVLLLLALLAILVGILFLYLEMSVYNFELKGGPMIMKHWPLGGGQWVAASLSPSSILAAGFQCFVPSP